MTCLSFWMFLEDQIHQPKAGLNKQMTMIEQAKMIVQQTKMVIQPTKSRLTKKTAT